MIEDLQIAELRTECEESLVSVAFTEPEALPELAMLVGRDDFNDPFKRDWFDVAVKLQASGELSRRTLTRELKKLGHLTTVASQEAFLKLGIGVGSGSGRYYAEQLLKVNQVEQLYGLLTASAEKLTMQSDVQSFVANCKAQFEAVCARETTQWEQAHDIAENVYNVVRDHDRDDEGTAYPTGFFEIDQKTGGFYPGQLWMLAAKSYMGKTTIALNFCQNQVDYNQGVYFASYEMEGTELLERMYANASGVHLDRIVQRSLTTSDLQSLLGSSQNWKGDYFCIDDRPPSTIEGLAARVALANATQKIRLLVIDHLLLLPTARGFNKRHEFLVDATVKLKKLAKDLDLTILVLNQVNMTAEGTPDEKDLAQSKELTPNLDVLCIAHRQSKTHEDLHMNFYKNRKGAPFGCWLKFLGEVQRVRERDVSEMSNFDSALAVG